MSLVQSQLTEFTPASKVIACLKGHVMTLPRRVVRCLRLAWDLSHRDQSDFALMEQWVRLGGADDFATDVDCQLQLEEQPADTVVETELTNETTCSPDRPIDPLDEARIKRGVAIVSEVIGRLRLATTTTEDAAIEIGGQVSSLFSLAQEVNESARRSLSNVVGDDSVASKQWNSTPVDERELSVVDLIYSQKENLSAFVDTIEQFVSAQKGALSGSSDAVIDVRDCVRRIDKIVLSSEVLALNVQIESVRLGEHGKAFSVLGEQMSDFSKQIHEANQAIQLAAALLSESIGKTRSHFEDMSDRVGSFSAEMARRMCHLEDRTNGLSEALHQTLTDITKSNDKMMSHSRSALSALQFQDPLSQDLLRSVHEIQKVQSLIEFGDFEDTRLADIDPSIGNDGTSERESGVVELF